jgi:hypothetical protein
VIAGESFVALTCKGSLMSEFQLSGQKMPTLTILIIATEGAFWHKACDPTHSDEMLWARNTMRAA